MIDKNKKFEDLTAEDCKELKIVFAPGAFDNFEGTQEELDSFIAEITRTIQSGEVLEKSRPIDDEYLENMSEEEMIQLATALGIDLETGELVDNKKRLQ